LTDQASQTRRQYHARR